jgi:hypothetical protein
VRTIQSLAGHASAAVVLDRYGHLLPGTEDKLAATLDGMARAGRRAVEDSGEVLVLRPGVS